MAAAADNNAFVKLASNRKAFHDYLVVERLEAGIELRGTEVKSLRTGTISLTGAYARLDGRDIVLYDLNIPLYQFGNRFNHDPIRPRRLLLHRREIDGLRVKTEQRGFALVPLSLYIKRGVVKVDLGVCRGKTHGDRRETLRRRTVERETARAVAGHRMRSI